MELGVGVQAEVISSDHRPVCENGILFRPTAETVPLGPGTHDVRSANPNLALGRISRIFRIFPRFLADGKHVYAVSDSGFAGCFDAESGKRVWFERLEGEFSSSPILIDGKIYVVNEGATSAC